MCLNRCGFFLYFHCHIINPRFAGLKIGLKMTEFIQKYEVQKARTVTCKMGVAHAGAILTATNFTGEDDEAKQKKIAAIVKLGSMKPIPLTDAEEEALAEEGRETTARLEKEAADELEKEESARLEKEAAEARQIAILEADFDEMNKDPMIQFAQDHGIELKATLAEDIREELKALQESLTAPE